VSYKTTFLFANPSYLDGAAHLLDFWGTYSTYNTSHTREQADAIALYADWRSVGEDLMQALSQSLASPREQAL
jgi:hypothetical protein